MPIVRREEAVKDQIQSEIDQLWTDDHEITAMQMLKQSIKIGKQASKSDKSPVMDLTKKGLKLVSFSGTDS